MHPALIAILSLIGAFLFWWLVVARITKKLHPFPIPWRLAVILDNPARRRFLSPAKTIEQIGVREGMRVLELGPGSGFLTAEASRRVGSGRLYCLDIEPALIARLKAKIEREGLENVDPIVGDGSALPLAEGSLDLAFLVGVLGEIPDKDAALNELYRVLRSGGVLSVWETLIDPDYSLRSTTISLGCKAGFEPFQQFGNFLVYVVNFRKG